MDFKYTKKKRIKYFFIILKLTINNKNIKIKKDSLY